ncbi:hypothetical protein K3N62_02465 [Streptococcus dysgalactiae subsp. dysgalactiae]|uniref:hypothetical protein n=3 Tax=Streptococcus dysgalactiae TaxID=1334 RepID=UPI0001F861DF|nr:hypothetical protein [Streptococcus dysgalactiae]EFY01829.1 hypothetical protein SDD27957_00675 [Streptococcus dysgalactiae subsp. dysgalactiae ATCC 27957]MCB2832390.1 hypothetical protein [Streptococcus dysgalactiae subsp. dysgalactiae]MCB2846361.1 hypothetical protein [Streptococcus dysgalactiae subsp. dysgalactiae]QBX07183.1 hypothetical protein JavanS121_0008 [Streptococcus satellite phage Javan121]
MKKQNLKKRISRHSIKKLSIGAVFVVAGAFITLGILPNNYDTNFYNGGVVYADYRVITPSYGVHNNNLPDLAGKLGFGLSDGSAGLTPKERPQVQKREESFGLSDGSAGLTPKERPQVQKREESFGLSNGSVKLAPQEEPQVQKQNEETPKQNEEPQKQKEETSKQKPQNKNLKNKNLKNKKPKTKRKNKKKKQI